MRKCIFFISVLSVCFASCNQDSMDAFLSNNELEGNNEMLSEKKSLLDEVYLKEPDADFLRPFAKALYKAMEESPMLREIIKTKALDKFNKEYDVLYQFIKDEPIEDGLTVRKLLSKHFENEEKLAAIEAKHPTLTIFVPQLPEDCFSAENWNTAEQVPAVAIHPTRQRNTVVISQYGFFDEKSDEFVLEAGLIPAFPVVVIKDNTRVVVSQNSRSQYESLNNKNSDYVFDFADEFYDGSKENSGLKSLWLTTTANNFDQKLIDAYNIYKNTDGWQRDYVYYGITPSNPNGKISFDFQESVIGFCFNSSNASPEGMLQWLNDPLYNDPGPTLKPLTSAPDMAWTAGQWTFKVNAMIGNPEAGEIGTTKSGSFLAKPEDLFEVTYKKVTALVYIPQVTGFKLKKVNVNLMVWDLKYYSALIKISVEKVNSGATKTRAEASSSEFAGNLSFDAGWGAIVKWGLKFGASAKTTHSNSYQIQTTTKNLSLGETFVNFGEKVILSGPTTTGPVIMWDIRDYNLSLCKIMLAPMRVQ